LQTPLRIWGNASTSEGDDRKNDPDWTREERISWLQLLVRIRPGELGLTQQAMDRAWAPQRDDLLPCANDDRERETINHRRWTFVSTPRGESRFRSSFRITGMLLAAVVGVMLILVCTNVSGLLLVRAVSRQREVGVRLALGAGMFRVLRPALMETLVLCVLGGAGGLVLSAWLLPAAARLVAPGQDLDLSIGIRSIAMMAGLVLVVALASALAPSVWIARVQPLRALAGQRGIVGAPLKLGRLLVVAQFALAVALVAVATTLGREVQRVLAADPGFDREHVMTAVFDPATVGYDTATVPALAARLRDTVLATPGVKAVTFAANGILAGSQTTSGIYLRGAAARKAGAESQHDAVAPGFFGTMGIAMLAGREFSLADAPKAQPVAVVSAAFAREMFGEANPIGQTFGYDAKPTVRDWTIVGVVADVRVNGVRARMPPMFFTPTAQSETHGVGFIAVRFEGPAAPIQTALSSELARIEPALVFSPWKTMDARMAEDLSGDIATTRLAAIFGVCAMVLAGAGIAGSLGYLVVLRQRDLALRMAIGANPGDLVRGVLADALKVSLAGAAIGIVVVCGVPMIPVVQTMLHGRPGWQPVGGAVLVAGIAAAVASIGPARRAARIDPMLVLKAE
jgi:predicted permease